MTEIAPDHASYDNFEFFEVHNTTNLDIDLAAEGYSFAYGPVNSDDMSSDVPLTAEENLVLGAGETAVYWLSYTSGNVDSYAFTEADFRAEWNVPADTRVVRITGQNGMANRRSPRHPRGADDGCRRRVGQLVALPGRVGVDHDHRALPHPR